MDTNPEPAEQKAEPQGKGPDRTSPGPGGNPALSLTIPLYDEEGNVGRVTTELLGAFRKAGVPLELLLVDNGSHDSTRALVQQLEKQEPEVVGVYLDTNQGYGGGILAGMQRASHPYLGYMWGDGQVAAEDVLRVYRRGVTDEADLSKARRIQRMDGWRRAVVSKVYNTSTLWLFHITSTDANGCPKIFARAAWEQLSPASIDWFLDPEIMIGVAEQGLKLAEVDVQAKARDAGVSKVGATTIVEFMFNLLKRRLKN